MPRPYRHHFGEWCRCPKCGTVRVTKLREQDQIDPMYSGLVNLLERIGGGSLYHCKFCRVQFYDRRETRSRRPSQQPADQEGGHACE